MEHIKKLITMAIQPLSELDSWHKEYDPWGYENNSEDKKRRDILLSEIPNKEYQNVLDIGCGQGFITKELPGNKVTGVDISKNAIEYAVKNILDPRINFIKSDLFDLPNTMTVNSYDLIIITGVIYPQYVGKSSTLIYEIIDNFLMPKGILISVHISEWYQAKFPFLLLDSFLYQYRDFFHKMEIYIK